ncbi:MAG: hypothetical protein J7L21_04305 [Sulfurimonas sp.]|nr:hypothetical protein [Sulfurimonas sp.]
MSKKVIYSTVCPNCNKEQELLQKVRRLIRSRKKSKMLFECDSCAFAGAVIFDGKDIFYKRSEVTEA